jgi:hypothetical protein
MGIVATITLGIPGNVPASATVHITATIFPAFLPTTITITPSTTLRVSTVHAT